MPTFADDTAILTTNKSAKDSNEALQSALDSINTWTKKWRIKLNHQKSVHVVFTTMQIPDYNLYLDGIKIPYSNKTKYIGMTLDTKLRWKEHIKKKRIELDIRLS